MLTPAEIVLPKDIKTVSLISRVHLEQEEGRLSNMNNIRFIPDSSYYLFTAESLFALAETLRESPRFEYVHIAGAHGTIKDPDKKPYPLNWMTITERCHKDSTDAVISLEYIELSDSLESFPHGLYCEAEFSIYRNIYWLIYHPKYFKLADQWTENDSAVWSRYGIDCESALYEMPPAADMLIENFNTAGEQYGRRIAPLWHDNITRVYYSKGPKEFKNAEELIEQDRWSEAIEIWRKLAEHKRKKTAAKAAFNMALATEVLDRLELALEWAQKSHRLYPDQLTRQYIKILNYRLKAKDKLMKQLTGARVN